MKKQWPRLSLCLLLVLSLLFSFSAQAALRYDNAALFHAQTVSGAIDELEQKLNITIQDNSGGLLTLSDLHNLERAVNLLSLPLFNEMTSFYRNNYGLTFTVRYERYRDQPYMGKSRVNVLLNICELELTIVPKTANAEELRLHNGTDLNTAVHELSHFLSTAAAPQDFARRLTMSGSGSAFGPVLRPLNNGYLYRYDYMIQKLGLSNPETFSESMVTPALHSESWQYVWDCWDYQGARHYFWEEYSQVTPDEDQATLLAAIADDSVAAQTRLLLPENAPLLTKYRAISDYYKKAFINAPASPLLNLLAPESPSAWAVSELSWANQRGLVPNEMMHHYSNSITRADFCRLLVPLFELSLGVPDLRAYVERRGFSFSIPTFTDTNEPACAMMAFFDVVEGRGDGRFDPNAPLTREEAAKILSLCAQTLGKNELEAPVSSFTDRGSFSPWAVPYIDYITAAGVMNGTGEAIFSPSAPYSREQAYLTVSRLYDHIVKVYAQNAA